MRVSVGPRFSPAQKLLASVLAVLGCVGAGYVTWRIVTSSESTSSANHVAVPYVVSLTESSMTVSRIDETDSATTGISTTVVSTTALPSAFDAVVVVDQGRWLLEDNRDTVVNYFDLAAAQPELRSVELPFAGWAIERRTVRAGNDSVLLYSPDGSLGLAVVNLVDGTAYPLASARAKYYEAGSVRDFMLFKEVDGLNTIIVSITDPTTYWTMKGAVVDIRDTRTLVATSDGFAYFVTVFDGLKPIGARVQVENPIMGGMLTDTGALVLERTGAITEFDVTTGKIKRGGVSTFGAQGALPIADDRLYGWGGDGSALLDPGGLPLASYLLGTTADGEVRPLVATAGGTGCLVLQPGPQLKPTGAGALLISVVDGVQLAELDASPSWVSADGCTLVGLDATVVIDGKPVDLGLEQVSAVSPDHTSVLGRQTAADGSATSVLLDVATKQVTKLGSGFQLYALF